MKGLPQGKFVTRKIRLNANGTLDVVVPSAHSAGPSAHKKGRKNPRSTFRVVRIDNGPRSPHTGIVSRHRTLEAAEAAVDRANQQLQRTPGYATAWHPYEIQQLVDGEWEKVSW
jgi:hypothetical protein